MQRDLGRQLKGIKADVVSKVRPELDRAAAAKVENDVRALGQRLAKARDAEAGAAGKVRIAEQRLIEARESGRTKASQLAAAEERLASTHRDLAAAQRVTIRVSEQVDTAHRRSAESAALAQRNSGGFVSSLRGMSAGFRDVDDKPLRRVVGTLARVGAYGTVAAGGIAAMGSSLPALVSLAGGLAAVAGAAGLIPAAIGAGGLAVGALVVGLMGIADAFKPTKQATGAVNSLAAAQRAADRSAIQGAEQVRAARQAVADAQVNGARRVQAAEAALTRAQQSSRDAQDALTRARKDAAEQLEDMRLALSGAGLDERAAELAVRRARQRLAEARAGGTTGLDLEEAVLGVDQAEQALKEVRERYADLKVAAAAASQAGVDGAENVIAAQRQVADATQSVRDAEADLAQARAEGARDMADAQRSLAQAQQQAAWAQADAATAIAQAQQALGAATPTQTALASSAAAFVAAVKSLGPAWTALRLDVQQRLFAGIAEHVTALGNTYLPILRTALGGVADSLNRGVRSVAAFFATPAATADVTTALADMRTGIDLASGSMRPLTQAWTDFLVVGASFLPGLGQGMTNLSTRFAEFIRNARETGQLREWIQGGLDRLVQLKDIAVNVGSVLGSIFDAANQARADFLTTLRDVTGELAAALKSPQGQQQLQAFFANLRKMVDSVKPGLRALGAAVASVVRDVAPALPAIAAAFSAIAIQVAPLLADLGALAGTVLPKLAAGLAFIAPITPYLLMAIGAIMGVVQAIKIWTVIQLVWNQVMNANPILRIISVLFLLAGALVYAYNHSDTFRKIVQRVWADIQAVVSWAWGTIIKPVLDALTWYLRTVVGPTVLWLWHNVVAPAFNDMGTVITWVWGTIIKPAFAALDWYLRTIIAPVVLWLWHNVVSPAFTGLGNTISWVWGAVISPTFTALRSGLDVVGNAFVAAVSFIGRAWHRLQEVAAIPVNFVIETVYNAGIKAVWDKVAGFVGLPLLPRANPIGVGGGGGQGGNRAFATGGIMPGYTPGRDVHRFWSPTAGVLDLSGGEPVLRPEVGRVLGASWVDGVNTAARTSGITGVQRYLGGYAGGGVLDRLEGIKNRVAGAADWTVGLIADPLGTIKRMFGDPAAQVRRALGAAGYVDLLARVPAKLVDAAAGWLAGKARAMFGATPAGGSFSGRGNWPPAVMGRLAANTAAAVQFVRQAFGINNIGTLGSRPNKSDHPMGKALDVMISDWTRPAGITKGTDVASWFVQNPQTYGTKYVIWRDRINSGRGWGPYSHPNGPTDNPTLQHRDHVHVSLYDDGGWLPPGWSTIYNGTGRPEPVLSDAQWQALSSRASGGGERHYHLTTTPAPTVDVIAQFRRMEMLAGP